MQSATAPLHFAVVIHMDVAGVPPSLLPSPAALSEHINPNVILHVTVPDLEKAISAIHARSDSDVLDMPWQEAEAKAMGSGGVIVLDPTGYCVRVCQASK